MLEAGVDLYELSPTRTQNTKRLGMFGSSLGRLHAKTAVIDKKIIFIGSMNLDPRSASTNTEFGMFIESPALAKELLRVINISKLESAYRVRLRPAPAAMADDEDRKGDRPRRRARVELLAARAQHAARLVRSRAAALSRIRENPQNAGRHNPRVLQHPALRLACVLAGAAVSVPALAIQVCELNGQPVNPTNGNTTAGKTGLMRCRDGEGGPVVREQELQQGGFMGVVRYFKDGALEREHRVNERGNRDGLAREWARAESGKSVLVREETYRDGRNTGTTRTWYPSGQLRRVSSHGDDDREQAVAEFTPQGQLAELRCATRPVLGSDFDDKTACGHAGAASNVTLYAGKGQPRARLSFERGERKKSETLWDNGAVHELQETTAAGGVERRFAADGTKRREVQWTALAERSREPEQRPRRVTTRPGIPRDRQAGARAPLARRRARRRARKRAALVPERAAPGAGTRLRDRDGQPLRRQTSFHDNGKKSFEGAWLVGGGGRNDLATGRTRASTPKGGCAASASTTSGAGSSASASSTSAAPSCATTRSSRTARERRSDDEHPDASRAGVRLRHHRRRLGRLRAGGAPDRRP